MIATLIYVTMEALVLMALLIILVNVPQDILIKTVVLTLMNVSQIHVKVEGLVLMALPIILVNVL